MIPILLLCAAPEGATAAAADAPVAQKPVEIRPWSTDLVDPSGHTRFHLVSRGTFGGGTGDLLHFAFEARAHFQLTDGVSLGAVLPVGLSTGRAGGAQGLIGNPSLGVSVGGEPLKQDGLRLRVAGGFDGYVPLAPDGAGAIATAVTLAALRSYDLQLFLPKSLGFRLRGHVEASYQILTVALEAGLLPVYSLAEDQDGFAMLMSAVGRVSVEAAAAFEPYLEFGGALKLAGDGELAPPFLVTPGMRFHFGDVFDPAIFATVNLVEPGAFTVGVDLASLLRPTVGTKKAKREREFDRVF